MGGGVGDGLLGCTYISPIFYTISIISDTWRSVSAKFVEISKSVVFISSRAQPLAIASGMAVDDIEAFQGVVDEILVASSVETGLYSGVFDKRKLHALIDSAHGEVEA